MTYPIGGVDWSAFETGVQAWVVAGSGLASSNVIFQQQKNARRPAAPAIEIRVANIAETGRPWLQMLPNPLVFADKTVSAVGISPANTLTSATHTLLTGDGPVRLVTTGTAPGGLAIATDYWVIAPNANTLQLADSYVHSGGGQGSSNPITPLVISSVGTGTHKIVATGDTVRAGQEIAAVSQGFLRVTLELHCHAVDGVDMASATAILNRIRGRRLFPSQIDRLQAINVGVIDIDRVRAIYGVQDAVLFEPRAYLELHLCVPQAEADYLTVIETVEVEDQVTGHTSVITVDGSD